MAKLVFEIVKQIVSLCVYAMGAYYGIFKHDYAQGAFLLVLATATLVKGKE